MFSFGIGSPSVTPTDSVAWTGRDSSVGRTSSVSRTSPTASITSHATSVGTTGVKTRQIRDLRLEIELRDHRIDELEQLYEETERKSAFSRGELQCRLDEQIITVSSMTSEQGNLRKTIDGQQQQLAQMQETMSKYSSMANTFGEMMERCSQLEKVQQETETKQQKELENQSRMVEEAALRANEEAAAKAAAIAQVAEEAERRRQLEQQVTISTEAAAKARTEAEAANTQLLRRLLEEREWLEREGLIGRQHKHTDPNGSVPVQPRTASVVQDMRQRSLQMNQKFGNNSQKACALM